MSEIKRVVFLSLALSNEVVKISKNIDMSERYQQRKTIAKSSRSPTSIRRVRQLWWWDFKIYFYCSYHFIDYCIVLCKSRNCCLWALAVWIYIYIQSELQFQLKRSSLDDKAWCAIKNRHNQRRDGDETEKKQAKSERKEKIKRNQWNHRTSWKPVNISNTSMECVCASQIVVQPQKYTQ